MGAVEQRTASQELVATVRSDQFIQEISLALPETVSPRRFARIAITAIQQNPDLALCSRDSVFQALLRCAADGLLPDGREAAIVKRGKTDPKASYMPMVDGYKKAAADYGWTLRGRVVHENDTFAYSEEPMALTHTPTPPGLDPGPMVCAYAVATHRDGRRMQRVMTADEIAKRRAMATTDQVWQKWPKEMWEKTPIRDLFKDLPLGDLDRERMRRIISADAAFEQAATDPVGALYGRDHEASPGIEPSGGGHPASETPSPGADRTPIGGGSQQQAAAEGSPQQPEAAAAGTEPEAEDAVWEPVDGTSEEETQTAGQLKVGKGVHTGLTIAQVAETEDGPAWLLAQLKKNGCPAEVETFVRGALPDMWARYLRWQETQA